MATTTPTTAEAWSPPTFAVGDRVRIRLSGECEHYHDGEPGGRRSGQQRLLVGHHASVDGYTGTVVQIDPDEITWNGHRVSVVTDQLLPRHIGRTVYAPSELMLLTAEADA